MHCCAALDTGTSGEVWVGDRELSGLDDSELTALRRDEIGFVFQSFNLVPTLTAEENILLPLSIAGRKPDRKWFDVVDRHRRPARPGCGTGPTSSPAASSSGWPWPGPWSAAPRSSSPTSRPATSTRTPGAEVLELLRRSVDEHGQTVVMVTHDAVAAAYTDRVVFLADGRIVSELHEPDREQVLAVMTRMTAPGAGSH